jgi:hypothetical protein
LISHLPHPEVFFEFRMADPSPQGSIAEGHLPQWSGQLAVTVVETDQFGDIHITDAVSVVKQKLSL